MYTEYHILFLTIKNLEIRGF